jgi:hypothetical protein
MRARNSLVRAVVFLFPGREFLALGAAVRDDVSGALVAAVGDGCGVADGVPGAGFFPAAGVVTVAGHGPADHHDCPVSASMTTWWEVE